MGNISFTIRKFAPSWFASVMGTGIVAVNSHFYANNFASLKALATALWVLNTILFVLLIIPWVLRFILYKAEALADFREPVTGQFYATMPIACLVVAKLIPYWPDSWQQLMLILNYISWGSGFFLFLLFEAICLYRFICCPPLPGKLAPTAWINLGPIGVGTIALINLGFASTPYFGVLVVPIFNLLSLFLWGFGFWWFVCAICLTVYYFSHNNLPFNLSWWAFTFPLGAYTGATYLVSSFLNSSVINSYGFLCYLLLLISWSFVFVRTIMGVRKGEFCL